MRSSSFLAAISLIALSNASPTPADLTPRACTTILPKFYQTIQSDNPSQSYPQNSNFQASQAAGAQHVVSTVVEFDNIPSGAYGCALGASFTYGYSIPTTGSSLLNVFALPKPISSTDSYSTFFPNGGKNNPEGAPLFGSVTLDGTKKYINSETCQSSLAFLFEIASDTDAGSVSFVDAGNNLSGIGGLYLTYNC